MTEDDKLTQMADISLLASKIGSLIMQDPLSMPHCSFACGIAMNAILEAHEKRGLLTPENAQLDLVQGFVKGLSVNTVAIIRPRQPGEPD